MDTLKTETRPAGRRRLACGVLAAVSLLFPAWAYRASGPRLDEAGGGFGIPVVVGDSANVGMLLRTDTGSVTLSDVSIDGPTDFVDVDFAFTARGPGEDGVGSYMGEVDSADFEVRRVSGATVDARSPDDGSLWLIVTFTPRAPGVYRFDNVTLEHGSLLRRFRDQLAYDVCLVAIESEREMADAVGACETTP